MSKRNFLRNVQSGLAVPSPAVTQSTVEVEPLIETHTPHQINSSLNSSNTSDIIPPSDQFINPGITTFSTDDGIPNYFNINNSNKIEKTSLDIKLSKWISQFHVSHSCVNALLLILISEGHDLPRTARTLLNTPKAKDHSIINIHPGSYIHLGVEYMMAKFLTVHLELFDNETIIELGMNVDGLPITSSSKSCLWPILISFVNIKCLLNTVIPVGLYHGKYKKPTSSHEYLNPFINEMKHILSNGIQINDKVLRFKIVQVVCDAPAKSFILNVKGHNAYHGCNSCTVEGDFIRNRMAYLDLNAPLRTDDSFRGKKDEFYHKDVSPLEELPIDISSAVVLEYMHNVCLGVMKRLLIFWVKGKKPVRLENSETISEELISLKTFLPTEFNRLPRSLEECEYWKATEFRTFLLYTGPIVLKGRLKNRLYKHFMILSCAIRLLISPKTSYTYNNVAKMLIKQFVSEYSTHYGEEYVGYNVHGLIHVADFVLTHGSLDTFSAFKYENYLQFLKKSCKNSRYPLEDTYNRIMEHINIDSSSVPPNYPILKNEINYDPEVNKSIDETYYKEIILNNYVINSKNVKDNFVYVKDHGIVKVINIVKFSNCKIKIEVIKYNTSPMFQNPISSDIIKMYYIRDIIPIPPLITIDIESIKYKCFTFPISNNKSVAIALLHTT